MINLPYGVQNGDKRKVVCEKSTSQNDWKTTMKRQSTHKYITVVFLYLVALALNACNNSVQVQQGISHTNPTIISQAIYPTPTSGSPDGASSQVFKPTLPFLTAATPTVPTMAADTPTTVPTLPQPVATSFTELDLKNAIYSIKDFAGENGGSDKVTLVDGFYAYIDPTNPPDPSNYTVQYLKSANGDLNADGMPDAAVILIADTSGSGTFIYLAAMVSGKGMQENIDTIYLGDRVVVETISIQDGLVQLQMITHGPQDAMCCPSVKTSQTYLLENGRLVSQVEKIIAPLANEIIRALKAKDMAKLIEFIDPSAGVRFSPYTNIKDTDLVFTPSKLANAFSDPTIYQWGNYEGSGALILLTFADYYSRFVYSEDFSSATDIGYNHSLSYTNVIDNSYDFYPNSNIVEYFLPGTNPEFGAGLDWQSLKLVFQQNTPGGQWYLVGIIHSQWTI
jgi:hypothetical protein